MSYIYIICASGEETGPTRPHEVYLGKPGGEKADGMRRLETIRLTLRVPDLQISPGNYFFGDPLRRQIPQSLARLRHAVGCNPAMAHGVTAAAAAARRCGQLPQAADPLRGTAGTAGAVRLCSAAVGAGGAAALPLLRNCHATSHAVADYRNAMPATVLSGAICLIGQRTWSSSLRTVFDAQSAPEAWQDRG